MTTFNTKELVTKAAQLADKENREYVVIPKSGAVRPFRDEDNEKLDFLPACLGLTDKPILVFRNCDFCWKNGLDGTIK
jgi:hypothetical protein